MVFFVLLLYAYLRDIHIHTQSCPTRLSSDLLPKNATVDARVCDDETAALSEEISMAENLIREAMSPADECSGYRAIIEKGATEEDVARRFGVTVRHVQGRLRLADLAEPIFNALAASEITLDVAKAYGSTPDRDAQLDRKSTRLNSSH